MGVGGVVDIERWCGAHTEGQGREGKGRSGRRRKTQPGLKLFSIRANNFVLPQEMCVSIVMTMSVDHNNGPELP